MFFLTFQVFFPRRNVKIIESSLRWGYETAALVFQEVQLSFPSELLFTLDKIGPLNFLGGAEFFLGHVHP